MKLGLALFLTLTSLFISGQCRSQCAIFAPGMAITQVNPGSPPFGEDVPKAIDGNIYTKYLNFNKTNTGFIVNTGKSVTAVRMDLTTANDEPSRDPINYQIQGSNNGTTWTNITSGNISCNSNRFLTRSFNFSNNISYSWYRITFPSLCNVSLANSMQVAEVQLYANSVAASVSILGNPSTTRKGISTFTAVPGNGGPAPTYQWYRNNVLEGTGVTYTDTSFREGIDTIRVKMTSSLGCVTNSPAWATFYQQVLSLTDVKYAMYMDSIQLQFTKNKEDIVYLYTFNEQSGLSTPLLTTMNMQVSIPHTARYYLIVSGNYSKFIGPFELVADERKRTLSTKQLLGQYTN
jgi:hypothetical protein